jgi:hypothetical protein
MYATVIPAGTLTIRASSDHSDGCELWLNDDFVGAFPSAAAAAQSVSGHRSGCDLIDAAQIQVPETIDSWQWISVSHTAKDQPMFLMGSPTETL